MTFPILFFLKKDISYTIESSVMVVNYIVEKKISV